MTVKTVKNLVVDHINLQPPFLSPPMDLTQRILLDIPQPARLESRMVVAPQQISPLFGRRNSVITISHATQTGALKVSEGMSMMLKL